MANWQRIVSFLVGLGLYGIIVICLHSKLIKSTTDSRLLSNKADKNDPPVVRFSLKLLEQASRKEDLDNIKSSQYKAAKWIAMSDNVKASSESQLLTRYALVFLHFSLKSGGELPQRYGDISECSWEGMECGFNNELVSIKMNGRRLTGTIPSSEWRVFTSLKTLDLSENKIQGTIPKEIWNLDQLESLYLYTNRLTGPALHPEMGKLANLKSLYLGGNQLTGSFPEAMLGSNRSMKLLRNLSVYRNKMTGRIPERLKMKNVAYFDLSYNRFSGTLPETLGKNFVKARHVYLDHNRFTGTIPSNYGMIGDGKVYELYLNDNKLTGTVPNTWQPGPRLSGVRFQNNMLSGRISGNDTLCMLSVLVGWEMVELSADCDICHCETLCEYCNHTNITANSTILGIESY